MAVILLVAEHPIVYIPRDLDRNSLHIDLLVSTELPFQVLDFQNLNIVEGKTEPGIVVVAAIDLDVPDSTADFGFRRVDFVSNYLFSFQNKRLRVFGFQSFGFGVSFLDQITDEEGHLVVNEEGDVESGSGLRSGPESGPGEIPEEAERRGAGEMLGARFFPEGEGVEVEAAGVAAVGGEMEGAGEEGAGPGEGEGGGGGLVEGGGEVGLAGHGRRRG